MPAFARGSSIIVAAKTDKLTVIREQGCCLDMSLPLLVEDDGEHSHEYPERYSRTTQAHGEKLAKWHSNSLIFKIIGTNCIT